MRILAPMLFALSLVAQDDGYLAPKLPDHVQLEPVKPAEKTEPARPPGEPTLRVIPGNQGRVRCAHIVTYKAPDVDPKIVIRGKGAPVNSRMPIIKGMDVCPEDVRELRNAR